MADLNLTSNSEIAVLGTIDVGNDGHQILLELLRVIDPTVYVLTDFVFSEPVALSGQDALTSVTLDPATGLQIAIVRNTRIFLTPKARTGYYGSKIIYYDRIHVNDLPAVTVTKGTSVTVYDILTKYNTATGLGIKQEDVFDGPLPVADASGMVAVPLSIKATSVVFYGTTKIKAIDYQFLPVPVAGIVYGTYCQGGNLMKIVSDGIGGVTITLGEANSVACPLPAAAIATGTLFAEYCRGSDLMHVVADGAGGVNTIVAEVNSASCPILVDSVAQTAVFAQQVDALIIEDVTINSRIDALAIGLANIGAGIPGAAGPAGADGNRALTIKTLTASYTLVQADGIGTLLRFDSVTDVVLTLPTDTALPLDTGSAVLISRNGLGSVSVAGMTGVTIDTPDTLIIGKRYGKISVIKVGANHWEVEGNLVPA